MHRQFSIMTELLYNKLWSSKTKKRIQVNFEKYRIPLFLR